MNTLLKDYINPDVLTDGYQLSSDETYKSPPDGKLQDYLDIIRGSIPERETETQAMRTPL